MRKLRKCMATRYALKLQRKLTVVTLVIGSCWSMGSHANEELDAIEARFNAAYAAAERSLELIPKEYYDIAALQQSLGSEPDVLRDWVRANTRWLPYTGALQGAQGVLLSRQGNSLDRALLLAALLDAAGHDARIASLELSGAVPAEYVAAAEKSMASEPWNKQTVAPFSATEFAQAGKFDHSLVAAALGSADADADQKQTDIHARVALHERQLLPLLKDAASRSPDRGTERVSLSLRQHDVVQYRSADGQWQELEILGESVPTPLVEAIAFDWRDIPEDRKHALSIEVQVNAQNDNEVRTDVVFKHKFDGVDLSGTSLALLFASPESRGLDVITEGMRQGDGSTFLREELRRHAQWIPTVSLSSEETIVDKGFTREGKILEKLPDSFEAVGKQIGGAAERLGALGGAPTPKAGSFRISRVEVVFKIHRPGSRMRRITRAIYQEDMNHTPEQAQLALAAALTRQTQLLPQTGRLPGWYSEVQAARSFLRTKLSMRHILSQLRKGRDPGPALAKIAERAPTQSPMLFGLAAARSVSTDSDYHLNELNLLSEFAEVSPPLADAPRALTMIDVLSNPQVHKQSDGGDAFGARFRAGLRDSVLETFASPNVATEFTTSQQWQSPDTSTRLIQRAQDLSPRGLSRTAFGAIAEDLVQGYWVMLADTRADPDRIAWWRVDPNTGDVLGMIYDHGLIAGGTSVETTIDIYKDLRLALALGKTLLAMFKCIDNIGGTGETSATVCFACAAVSGAVSVHSLAPGVSERFKFWGSVSAMACETIAQKASDFIESLSSAVGE